MPEQATGYPGPGEATAEQRTVLVVDLDGDLLTPLRAAEEILLTLGAWEDDDPAADTEPLRLPAPLAGRVALAAVRRLLTALAPTQSQPPHEGRLIGPDGRYEHAPLTVISVPAADIDLLSATAAALGHPGLDPDIADLVNDHAGELGRDNGRADRTELASLLARLAGLLGLACTDDIRLLADRLGASPPGADCVLNDAEEAAYVRTADRMNHMWAHGSVIDRYLY